MGVLKLKNRKKYRIY